MRQRVRKVMLVDDDDNLRRLLAHKLRGWGYETIELDCGAQVLDKLVEEDCQCILLDIELPDGSGIELLSQIKRAHGGVKVIMLTGVVSIITMLQSMRRGAEAVIFKPVHDFNIIAMRLRRAFESIDDWWECLQELKRRKDSELAAPEPDHASHALTMGMEI